MVNFRHRPRNEKTLLEDRKRNGTVILKWMCWELTDRMKLAQDRAAVASCKNAHGFFLYFVRSFSPQSSRRPSLCAGFLCFCSHFRQKSMWYIPRTRPLPLTSHGTPYKAALWRSRTKREVCCSSGRNGSFKVYPKETGCVNWNHLAQGLVNCGPNTTANLRV